MTLASKSGSLIVKDGKLAEDCGCCGAIGDICQNPPSYLRMTATGMPNALTLLEGFAYAARSPYDDNGSEYTLYRDYDSYSTLASCRWRGGPHGLRNRINAIYEQDAWSLDAANERLYGYGFIFNPPAGASFRKLPYTDTRPLVVQSQFSNGFGTPADWSSVVVEIHSGKSTTPDLTCPQGGYGTVCAEDDITRSAIVTPCSRKNWTANTSVADLGLSVTVDAAISERRTAGISSNGNTEWESFNPQELTNGSLSFLSGDYDLAWKSISSILSASVGLGAPEGWRLVSEGYRIGPIQEGQSGFYGIGALGGFNYSWEPWLAIAVRPTAFQWHGGNPETYSRCADGSVAFGVHCVLFDTFYSTAGAGPSEAVCGAYAPAPCAAYSCGDTPSFSVQMSAPIQVRLSKQTFGPWIEIRGTVNFTVSAS